MPAPIGAEDLFRFRWIDHVRLTRDGERVAYQLSWADEESRQNRSRVVVRRLLDQEPVEATAGPRRDHSPEWAPDGRHLAFMSRRGATDQVFVLEVASGGDARQVTFLPEGASSPVWSPDGSRIAFIGNVVGDPDGVVDDPRPPENKDLVRRAPVARVARRLDYKHDGRGYVDGRYQHLFTVPAGGGDVAQLTSGAWDVSGFDWSPDGTKLAVAGNADPNSDLQRELDLYIVDLEGNREKLAGGFLLSAPAWSPRGDLIAFLAPNGLEGGLIERLWVQPVDGGSARCLTLGLDQAAADSLITDMRAGHGQRLTWSDQGDRVYFLVSGPGVCGVHSADLEGNVRPEVGGQRRIFDFDAASGVTAFCASDTSSPGELHVLMQGAEAKLTNLNPWLAERYVAQPERHQFTSPDGWVIEGWVLKPDGFDPNRRYPLVLEVHGGPHGQYGWAFMHEFQILAGMGYVVLYINPRGSDGYGERFRRDVVRDWGGRDYVDLMSALDQLIDRTGFVDITRMGIGGGSYGGYMTNWVIGQTDRFSAAVAMRSLSNLVSEYAQHDIVIWGGLELGPPPWPDLDELWRRSPIRYVQHMRTPLLLTCGEMDLRTAISQSEELFGAMRLLGKTVEMVRFPEESHDLSRNGRPDRRVERLRRIAGWYERFLGTESAERPPEMETQILPTLTRQAPVVAEVAETAAVEEVVAEVAPPEPPPAEPLPPETEPELEPEPEPVVAVEAQHETLELVAHPEVATTEAPVLTGVEPMPLPAEAEASVPEPEAEAPEPEAATEVMPTTPEPVVESQPEPEPEPATAVIEALPVLPEPEPLFAEPVAAAPEPAPVAPEPPPVVEPEPSVPAPVAQTVIAWPTGGAAGMQGNGPPSQTAEPATSLTPAWRPTDVPPSDDARATVSLRAIPPELAAAGIYAAKLTFESGPFAGRVEGLPERVVTLGRAPDNDVVIGDPATSGRHGRIELRAGAFWISDLGSTNGTLVNGEPIIEKELDEGDLIAIGQNIVRFNRLS